MKAVLKEKIEEAGFTFCEEKTGTGWQKSHIKYTKLEKIPQYIPELDIDTLLANAIVRELQLINKSIPVTKVYVDEESRLVYIQ